MGAKQQQEPTDLKTIREFFSFLNSVLELSDSPATFESYEFYKERVLANYEETQLNEELLPIDSFSELLPGSRIFWLGSIVTKKQSVEFKIKIEAILNIGKNREVEPESVRIREIEGVDTSNAKKRRWLNDMASSLVYVAIRVISGVITHQMKDGT